MKYFDKLSNLQKQFLKSLGINGDEDMPQGFFEIIKPLAITQEEMYCVSDYNKVYCYNGHLDMTKLVGTNHEKYVGKSWIEAFSILSRGDEIIEAYFKNPEYYSINDSDLIDIGVVEKNGYYYIFSKNGGGNNRLITMKLLSIVQLTKGLKLVSPAVRIRQVPSMDTCQNIFYCEFPTGNYITSGYTVKKSNLEDAEEIYDVMLGPISNNSIFLSGINGKDILKSVAKKMLETTENEKKL